MDEFADAVARLPEREKLVVALLEYERATPEEAAAALGITPVEVERIRERARLRMAGAIPPDSPTIEVDRPATSPPPREVTEDDVERLRRILDES